MTFVHKVAKHPGKKLAHNREQIKTQHARKPRNYFIFCNRPTDNIYLLLNCLTFLHVDTIFTAEISALVTVEQVLNIKLHQ